MNYNIERTTVIGGEKPHPIHGGVIFELPSLITIHENTSDNYYWIDFYLFGSDRDNDHLELIVYEGTEEYDRITTLLSAKDALGLSRYANIIIVKYTEPEFIVNKVEEITRRFYMKGQANVQRKMKDLLAIK